MIKLTSPKRTYRPRKPAFFVARFVALSVAVAFAAFTVTQYALSLWETNQRLAVFIGTVFGLSALMTPCLVPILTRVRGFAAAGLAIVVLAFGAVDSVGLSMAFTAFEKQATLADYKAAQADLDARRAPLMAKIASAEADRDAVELPKHDYTSRQKVALTAYEAQIAVHQRKIDEAKADLAKLPASAERPDMFDNGLIGVVSVLIQIALAIAFGAIEAARNQIHAKDLADYEERREDARAERRKAKTVAKRKATMEAKTKYEGPRLVK